jgi:3-dehydroquinate dehydratase
MYTEARKINLIEAVLSVNNEAILIELETVIKKIPAKEQKKKLSAHNFLGTWSKKDAILIEKAIHETCEQIHEDDWK